MSVKLNIYNQAGEAKGAIEVSEKIFGVKMNNVLVQEAVVAQMANERQVLADTKDRSEVRGGGKKPWQQKGTGRARAGSSRSPIWIGGGVTFGPTSDRNFSKKVNKKAKRKAIFMVLSDRSANNTLAILENLELVDSKTKTFDNLLNNLESKVFKRKTVAAKKSGKIKQIEKRSVLFINAVKDDSISRAGRNLVGVKMINLGNINIVDLLKYKNIIFTEEAVKKFEETYKE